MTISTSRNDELSVDQVCTSALQLAGLNPAGQTPQAREIGQARLFLDTVLKELQTAGRFGRSVTFYNLTLVAGTYKYALPADVLEMVGDTMFIPVGEDVEKAAGETLVQQQSRDAWQRNSAKDAVSQPTLYFFNKAQIPPEVWVWPIPDAANAGTLRVQYHRLTADTFEGASTVDLRQFWVKYLVYAVAEMLAEAGTLGSEKISRLHERAEQYLRKARGRANQGVDMQMSVAHGSGRRRR